MISCTIQIDKDIDALYDIFLTEHLQSPRAKCEISKNKTLDFKITAKDPVSLKAFMNSILNIIQTYQKVKAV